MIRKIVQIDEEKCTGCGLCAHACHESAIAMVDGKAKLIRDDYCDGFGDCLPVCPADAISFVEREALPYDEEAVKENQRKTKEAADLQKTESGRNAAEAGSESGAGQMQVRGEDAAEDAAENGAAAPSQLRQWPVQIKLVQERASMFAGANLLVAADCTAYAYGDFHQDFIRNHVVLVGCTKLDDIDYSEKLARIFLRNEIKSITVARMEVPCCAGMERAVKMALKESGKKIPVKTVVISTEGEILQ